MEISDTCLNCYSIILFVLFSRFLAVPFAFGGEIQYSHEERVMNKIPKISDWQFIVMFSRTETGVRLVKCKFFVRLATYPNYVHILTCIFLPMSI